MKTLSGANFGALLDQVTEWSPQNFEALLAAYKKIAYPGPALGPGHPLARQNAKRELKKVFPNDVIIPDGICIDDYDIPFTSGAQASEKVSKKLLSLAIQPQGMVRSFQKKQECFTIEPGKPIKFNLSQLREPVKLGSLLINRNDPDFVARVERMARKKDYGSKIREADISPARSKSAVIKKPEADDAANITKTASVSEIKAPSKIPNSSATLKNGACGQNKDKKVESEAHQRRQRIAEYSSKIPKPRLPPVGSAPSKAIQARLENKQDPLFKRGLYSAPAGDAKSRVLLNHPTSSASPTAQSTTAQHGSNRSPVSASFQALTVNPELEALAKTYIRDLRVFEKIKRTLPGMLATTEKGDHSRPASSDGSNCPTPRPRSASRNSDKA